MASVAWYVAEMMDEFQSSSNDVELRVERAVQEVVVDILLQNESRFRRLEKKATITFTTADDAKKLPAAFHSVKRPMIEIDSDGAHVAEIEIVTDREFWNRKANDTFAGVTYATIETRQMPTPAEYLLLSGKPSETRFMSFGYYRLPAGTDADIIKNTGIVKNGIRARFKEFLGFDGSQTALRMYESSKASVIEHPGQRAGGMALKPNKQQRLLNKRMHTNFRYRR